MTCAKIKDRGGGFRGKAKGSIIDYVTFPVLSGNWEVPTISLSNQISFFYTNITQSDWMKPGNLVYRNFY